MRKSEKKQLLDLLLSIAMYNEKGRYWARGSAEDVRNMRRGFRTELDRLIREIGESNLPPQILVKLRDDIVLLDDEGSVHHMVEQCDAD